jgi:hypothetical protein
MIKKIREKLAALGLASAFALTPESGSAAHTAHSVLLETASDGSKVVGPYQNPRMMVEIPQDEKAVINTGLKGDKAVIAVVGEHRQDKTSWTKFLVKGACEQNLNPDNKILITVNDINSMRGYAIDCGKPKPGRSK